MELGCDVAENAEVQAFDGDSGRVANGADGLSSGQDLGQQPGLILR